MAEASGPDLAGSLIGLDITRLQPYNPSDPKGAEFATIDEAVDGLGRHAEAVGHLVGAHPVRMTTGINPGPSLSVKATGPRVPVIRASTCGLCALHLYDHSGDFTYLSIPQSTTWHREFDWGVERYVKSPE